MSVRGGLLTILCIFGCRTWCLEKITVSFGPAPKDQIVFYEEALGRRNVWFLSYFVRSQSVAKRVISPEIKTLLLANLEKDLPSPDSGLEMIRPCTTSIVIESEVPDRRKNNRFCLDESPEKQVTSVGRWIRNVQDLLQVKF